MKRMQKLVYRPLAAPPTLGASIHIVTKKYTLKYIGTLNLNGEHINWQTIQFCK